MVTRLVELNIRCLTKELNILHQGQSVYSYCAEDETNVGFLLANHDRSFEMNVNDDEQFMIAWLEEQMFDVAEKYVFRNNSEALVKECE